MAKVEHTSDARVLVGIDISKHRHEVLIAVPDKTRRRRMMTLPPQPSVRRPTKSTHEPSRPNLVWLELARKISP